MPDARPPVLSLFTELAALPSASGEERAVADRVADRLDGLGLAVVEDDAGARVASTAGNLLARVPPRGSGGGRPILLCAHLDTVPPDGPIEPVVADGVVTNAAGTILGADDKAAIAVMLDAVRRLLADGRPHAGVELLFTVREETGLQGAGAFDPTALAAEVGFVYDCEGPIGDLVTAAPACVALDVAFTGRASHAGLAPEEGRSAIAAAARAIADLRLGRIDAETTANVGVVAGGTARNVVPERCALRAEARSRNPEALAALVQEMVDVCAFAATVSECELDVRAEEQYEGYRLRADDPQVVIARAALAAAGFAARPIEANGAADVNVLNARGLACVNLANGMARIHTSEERIAVADLEAMVEVTLGLVDAARRPAE